MYKGLRKISERGDELFILNKDGVVVRMPSSEKENLEKFADLENLPKNYPKVIQELADAGILYFKNYRTQPNLNYDAALINSKNDKPIYQGPIIAHLAITNYCNMQCKYCSVRKTHERNPFELETADYKKIIQKLVKWGALQIGFTGGEPTLRKDLVELTKYVVFKGVACNMTTNGWFLDKKLAEKLYAAGMEQAQISLDSYKKSTHEKYRNPGSFSRALKSMQILRAAGFKVGVDCVVSKNNLEDIWDFIKFLEQKQISGLTLIKLKQGDLPFEVFQDQVPDYTKYGKLIEKICQRKNLRPEVTIDCGSVANLNYSLTDKEITKLHSAGCPAGHTLISIAPNGDIYPCAALLSEKYKLGNILKDNSEKIWQGSPILKKLRNIKKEITGNCKNCNRLDICRGGCRGIAESLVDNLFASDPTCQRKEVN